jgi:hypothetical protein
MSSLASWALCRIPTVLSAVVRCELRKVKERSRVEALGSDSYRRSGWEETFSASALPANSAEISAWAFDAEAGKAFELEGNHDVGGTLGDAVRVVELAYRGAVYGQGSREGRLG